jgi:sugar lactone lactonase YvrE
MQAVQVTDALCEHGEGAVWWGSTQSFRWLDMNRGSILERAVGSPEVTRRETGLASIAFLRPCTTGGFVAGSGGDLWHFDADKAGAARWVGRAEVGAGERFNEGCCDPAGRVLAGSTTIPREPGGGALYRFAPDGTAERLIENVTLGNGISFTDRSDVFYFVDTPTRRMSRCGLRGDGSVAMEEFLDLSAVEGWPDGLCVDSENAVWVAFFGGAQVRRYDADGTLTDVVALPTPSVTSCALGGTNLTTLFITSSQMNAVGDPIAGAAFEIEVDVPGIPVLEAAGF